MISAPTQEKRNLGLPPDVQRPKKVASDQKAYGKFGSLFSRAENGVQSVGADTIRPPWLRANNIRPCVSG